MSYLEEIASAVKDALPTAVDVPEGADDLFVLYAVLVRTRGTETTARDVHDAWSAWMMTRDPSHASLVPYEDLSADVQSEDLPYLQAIRTAASRIHRGK